jgi:chromosome segregation ATPase
MNADINQQINRALDQKLQIERLQARLLSAHRQLLTKRSQLSEVEQKLKSEEEDVERLSHLSLAELFYTILGSKEEQLEKERQEALAARLEYTQVKHAVDSLQQEIEALQSEIASLPDVEALISRLKAEREAAILQAGGANADRLRKIDDQFQDLRKQQKEVQEAVSAGDSALHGLEGVLQSLGSAENWGVWDLLGGGLLADFAKHSRIDDARDQVFAVQELLRRFQRELSDVDMNQNVLITIDSFDRFADTFFDGLITDWIVQSKIQDSLKNVQGLYTRVAQILTSLKQQLASLDQEIARLEADRQAFMEQITH